ncbi:MAG TPA: DUF928 domain-containing protein [Verrucomicrobiae bacterium]|nr:DUF928 domain-containing protein [Verrucomicrobiae bacterium]
MKRSRSQSWFLAAAISVIAPAPLGFADPTNQAPGAFLVEKPKVVETNGQVQVATPGSQAGTRIVYKPPLRGAPAVRIDGGSRGSGVSLTCLTVLAPDHTGLTIHDQPSLFWYQSAPADVPFELAVIEEGKPEPLFRLRHPDARASGIQHVNLADYNVKLATGVEYEWVVALVVDPESRSKDVIASGFIKRVEPTAGLTARLAHANPRDLPAIYADEGIWYDTVESLFALADARPRDQSLRAESAALLDQAGLAKAAAYAGRARDGD